MSAPHASESPPVALRAAVAILVVGALGAAIMAVAHLGVELPLLPTVGAGRPVPPAATAFGVGTLLYGAAAVGLFRGRRWAWWLGVGVLVLTFAGCVRPHRGTASAIGIALSAVGLVLLLLPAARQALLGPRRPAAR